MNAIKAVIDARWLLAAISALSLLLACDRFVRPGGIGSASLLLAPVFEGSAPHTVQYNRLRVLLARPDLTVAVDATFSVVPGEEFDEPISVPLNEDPETFTLEVTLLDSQDVVVFRVEPMEITLSSSVDPQPIAPLFEYVGPPLVSIAVDQSSLPENDGVATVTVTVAGANTELVTVDLGFSGTAVFASDYSHSGTEIMIPAGGATGTVTVETSDDTIDELDEVVVIDIVTVTNATEDELQQVTVTIVDDDDPPTVALAESGSPIAEAAGAATVTATLSEPSGQTIRVDLGFSGSATFTDDYTVSDTSIVPGVPRSIVIAAGETTGSLMVTAVQDALVEGPEEAFLDITGVGGDLATEVGTQQARIEITDDDLGPSVTLSQSGSPIAEAGGVATVTAALSESSVQTIRVDLGFSGTAMFTGDYAVSGSSIVPGVPRSIVIDAGSTTGSLTVTAIQDVLVEGPEEVIVDITGIGGDLAREVGVQQARIEISDDDGSGLLARWPGDGNADDVVGTRNGVLQNGATFDVGEIGQAFSFAGDDDHVEFPAFSALNAITVSLWVNPDKTSGNPVMFMLPNGGGGNEIFFGFAPTSEDLRLVLNDATHDVAGTGVTSGVWTHLALTFDGSVVTVYKNGGLIDSYSQSATLDFDDCNGYIGQDVDGPGCSGNPSNHFDGRIDDVTVYSTALTAAEVAALVPVCVNPPPGLIAWWPSEGSGADAVGVNDLTLNGVTFATGRVGQGFQLDGIDDFGQSVAALGLVGNSAFTVEVWALPGENPGDGAFGKAIIGWGVSGDNRGKFLYYNSTERTFESGFFNNDRETPPDYPSGAWYHVVDTFDGATHRMFVNGVETVTDANIGVLDVASAPVVVGVDPFGQARFFNGAIDELSLYSRALTAAETEALFVARSAGKCR